MIVFNQNYFADLATLVIGLAALGVIFVKWHFKYWERKGVINPPPRFPYGNAAQLFKRELSFGAVLKKNYQEYKAKGHKYIGYFLGMQRILLVFDPELLKTIMTRDFIHFRDHGNYINEENDPLTGNLFMLKGEKWRDMRVKLTPTFTSGKMKMMLPTLVDCSKELIVVMDGLTTTDEGIDIKDIVGRFTTDVIGSCAFGVDCNSLKNPQSEFRDYGRRLFDVKKWDVLKRFLANSWPWVLNTLKIPLIEKDVADFFTNTVRQIVDYREQNHVVRKDFMHLLIQLKNNVKLTDEDDAGTLKRNPEAKAGLTLNEMAAQAFVFFTAGFETSSTTLTFCFYELVSNSELQEKLRREVKAVLARHDGNLTYEALSEMTYMDKCIQETLRKYPPIPIILRECTKTYQMPNSKVIIDKGVRVLVPILGIQHDPEYYPDPDRFDPERFSPEQKAGRPDFTWLPFGEGPRLCIGLRFGMMQTKVALAVLLKRYRFSLNEKTQVPLVMDPKNVILSTKGGVWLNAQKLDDDN